MNFIDSCLTLALFSTITLAIGLIIGFLIGSCRIDMETGKKVPAWSDQQIIDRIKEFRKTESWQNELMMDALLGPYFSDRGVTYPRYQRLKKCLFKKEYMSGNVDRK